MLKNLKKHSAGFNRANSLKKRSGGFTIIEVLIVLAIAGLILLVVFLAVPALQRNSRNTQYRSEASQLLAAANEFSNNNSGSLPAASNSGCGGTCDAKTILGLTKSRNITLLTVEAQGGTTAATLTGAVLRTGGKCSGNTTTAGSTRQVALVFAIEDSGGNATPQCIDS